MSMPALYLLLEFGSNASEAYGFIPHVQWHVHYSWLL